MAGGAPGLGGLGVVQVPVKDIEIEHVTTPLRVVMGVVQEIRSFMKDVTIVKVNCNSYNTIVNFSIYS